MTSLLFQAHDAIVAAAIYPQTQKPNAMPPPHRVPASNHKRLSRGQAAGWSPRSDVRPSSSSKCMLREVLQDVDRLPPWEFPTP